MKYRVFSTRCHSEIIGAYRGWGIRGRDGTGQRVFVEDISEDREFVCLLAAALNRERVEPVHVYDIITDFLSDPERKKSLLHG